MNGWKLVPVEPDLDMQNEAWRELDDQGVDIGEVEVAEVLRRAIAAAPQPPVGGDVEWENNLLTEMSRRFDLHRSDEQWMCVDDTQIGVEFAADLLRPVITARDDQIAALQAQLASSEKWAREHCNRAEDFAGQILEMKDQAEACDQQITALQARVADLETQLQDAHTKFKYIADGGAFYLSTAAEGKRNAHYALAQQDGTP